MSDGYESESKGEDPHSISTKSVHPSPSLSVSSITSGKISKSSVYLNSYCPFIALMVWEYSNNRWLNSTRGTPEITPVDLFISNPSGSSGETL